MEGRRVDTVFHFCDNSRFQMNAPDPKPNSGRKLFYGLFVFPLLILAGMIVMVCSVILLTNEHETPESLVAAIKKAPDRKRWQKASELSNELNRLKPGPRDEALMAEIAGILRDPKNYDAKTRAYMAMALGRFGPSAVGTLRETLDDPEPEVRFFALWALGTLRAKETAPDVARFLYDDRPELRVNAAYVLGAIGDPTQAPPLRPLLGDPVADVRWNAALALARLGDDSGWKVLVSMLDRSELASSGMDEAKIETAMINAIKGLALIRRPESVKILGSLARDEKNLRVRQAAMEAVKLHRADA